ncbi:MAG: hypothetical protein U0V48_15070 [Anaerolineales bacterium]
MAFPMPCPPDDKPSGYTYEGDSSRLARFSGLCTNSTVVYHRAGSQSCINRRNQNNSIFDT